MYLMRFIKEKQAKNKHQLTYTTRKPNSKNTEITKLNWKISMLFFFHSRLQLGVIVPCSSSFAMYFLTISFLPSPRTFSRLVLLFVQILQCSIRLVKKSALLCYLVSSILSASSLFASYIHNYVLLNKYLEKHKCVENGSDSY